MGESNYKQLLYAKRRKRRRRKIIFKRIFLFVALICVLAGGTHFGIKLYSRLKPNSVISRFDDSKALKRAKELKMPLWIDEDIIDIHNTARTGAELDDIKNIVIHYVGNPNTTAKNNRDYFNKSSTEVSSHFLVGLDGEVIQCVPLWEKSAASNWRNNDTISIEVCHPDKSGEFTKVTYNSVIKLTAWLLNEFGLDESAVIRHYDITGKECPKYYVDNENAWNTLKKDVKIELNEYKE